MIMKIKQIFFLVFVVTNLIACSSEPGCFIVDSVKLVKTIKIDSRDYFIYLRISGFQDKVAFYELYKGKPTFGECKQSNIEPISYDSVDWSDPTDSTVDPFSGVVSRIVSKLVIDDDLKLSIVYIKGNVQEIDLKDVPVEVKALTN